MSPPLADDLAARLVARARAATAQAFLSRDGGVRYGAAVLTASGRTFGAGQYASFNHVTNVHAEQAALLLAAADGEPDVVALAVACTGGADVARPCGVCRQVLLEHAARTGRDFEVLMARRQGGFERARVGDLLPLAWQAHTGPVPAGGPDLRPAPDRPAAVDGPLAVGEHVLLGDGCVAMVWDPCLTETDALLKVKYAPAGGGLVRKVAHSFTEPLAYERELADLGRGGPAFFGGPAVVAPVAGPAARWPTLPGAAADLPPGFRVCLEAVGVAEEDVRVGGSLALGVPRAGSDRDLVIRLTADAVPRLRRRLAEAVEAGRAVVPERSGSWRLLDGLFPGGRAALLRSRRFVDTVAFDGLSLALILSNFSNFSGERKMRSKTAALGLGTNVPCSYSATCAWPCTRTAAKITGSTPSLRPKGLSRRRANSLPTD